MCDIFGSHNDESDAATAAAQQATAAANQALLAQKQSQDQATAASDSFSEGARVASEDRMRKLLAAGPFGAALPTDYGTAQVTTRQLYGA